MHPVVLRWGAHSLYWYSVLMCLGIALGVAYAWIKARAVGMDAQWRGGQVAAASSTQASERGFACLTDINVLDGALCVLAGGLAGARAAYVIPNWTDYAGRPTALFRFWGGGLVFQGGLLGGLLALLLYSLCARAPFARLLDLAAPAVALAQGLGWIGALLHGANYGVIMRSPLSLWLPDLYGVYGPRFPTQVAGALLGFLLFWGLHRLSRRGLWPGILGLLYLFANGLGHFILEFTRADEAPFVGLLRITQWAELAEVVAACVLLLYLWRLAVMSKTSRRTAQLREG